MCNTDAGEADPMQTARTHRNTRLSIMLALLTGIGVLTSTSVAAEESIFGNVNLFKNAQFEDMLDGDVRMVGKRNAGLHLSSTPQSRDARYYSQHDSGSASDSGVHLSWKLSW